MRAIDFHVHLPTPEWLDVSMRGYIEAAESYFRSKVARRSLDELARDYEAIDTVAVLLAWDAETATGRPRVPNELVAQAVSDHPGRFVGFGSVDPLKGESAVDELDGRGDGARRALPVDPAAELEQQSVSTGEPVEGPRVVPTDRRLQGRRRRGRDGLHFPPVQEPGEP